MFTEAVAVKGGGGYDIWTVFGRAGEDIVRSWGKVEEDILILDLCCRTKMVDSWLSVEDSVEILLDVIHGDLNGLLLQGNVEIAKAASQ